VRDIGVKGEKHMSEQIQYSDEPLGEFKIIPDFLPSPDQLVLKEERVKITISLNKESVLFFKKEAEKYQTQYQKMIRGLLDSYVSHQKSLAR